MSSEGNADNHDLQPLRVGPFILGHVDCVNGDGVGEVPEYTPTRAELLALVKYWESEFLNSEYFVFATAQHGSTEMRLRSYARRRVGRIIDLLGEEAVGAAREARRKFAIRVGSRNWAAFCKYLQIGDQGTSVGGSRANAFRGGGLEEPR